MEYILEDDEDWPDDCFQKYERIEILGKGSFGMVWMSRRLTDPVDEFDDEYVAIKNIYIKNEKGKVYAEREIRILQELKHPNVIRLIQAYPLYNGNSRVVVMQLARGPNLHQLVVKRGALGMPLCRLISQQLIAAVSYIHGRAVIHRDIKPSNCILALTNIDDAEKEYEWFNDKAIWSNDEDGIEAVKNNKWKLMLVDFGFARALEMNEIEAQAKKMRNSIMFEVKQQKQQPPTPTSPAAADKDKEETKKNEQATTAAAPAAATSYTPRSMYPSTIMEDETARGDNGNDNDDDEDDSIEADMAQLETMVIQAVDGMRKSFAAGTNGIEEAIFNDEKGKMRQRQSGVSMPIPEEVAVSSSKNTNKKKQQTKKKKQQENHQDSKNKGGQRRISTARKHVRSMSALGTKAYAAPEIRRHLRHKTEADFEKANAAMTECVADYGMIVDAYSVGWTLRVAITGVPPNFTISEYLQERSTAVLEGGESDTDETIIQSDLCCCFAPVEIPVVKIRDPVSLPPAATLLITRMTEKKPENRMTVREAQNDPWIKGGADANDPIYKLPIGDVPSRHGDPVVPLQCAPELSELTVEYHMS